MLQMTNGFPRWFRLLFVLVMLTLCTVMVTQIIQHHDLSARIADLRGKIETAEKRLAKQQAELEEYSAELPVVLAELETIAPAAEAAVARVAELKAQRSILRGTVADQAALIADLQARLAALPVPADTATQVDAALFSLSEAQSALPD